MYTQCIRATLQGLVPVTLGRRPKANAHISQSIHSSGAAGRRTSAASGWEQATMPRVPSTGERRELKSISELCGCMLGESIAWQVYAAVKCAFCCTLWALGTLPICVFSPRQVQSASKRDCVWLETS